MARKFLTPIDLAKNELQNAAVQSLGSAPSSPVKFQLYGNSGDNTLYWWDGAQWIAAKAAAGATPAGTVTTSAVGDAGVVGVSTNFAREDHKHGREAFAAAVAATTFGLAKVDGAAVTLARSDHHHGTPTHDAAAHSAIPLSALAVPTGSVSFNGQLITNVATPVSGTDATNKNYVDGAINGLSWKDAVRAASTANLALSGLVAVDGVTPVANDRILVKNQTTTSANGIYLAQSGAWTRTTDADTEAELLNAAVFVSDGTTQSDTAWVLTTNAPITVGTTAIAWTQFGAPASYIGGAGMTLTGTTFDVGAGAGITVAADSVALDTTYTDGRYVNVAGDTVTGPLDGTYFNASVDISASGHVYIGAAPTNANDGTRKDYVDAQVATRTRKFSALCTANASQVVTHNLNTTDVVVSVYTVASTFDEVECDIQHTSVNTITAIFATAPAAGQYRFVVVG